MGVTVHVFPAWFRTGNKGWVLISETGVDSRYCASRLMGKDGGLYTIGFPQEGEYNGNGTACPGIALPGENALAHGYRGADVGTDCGDHHTIRRGRASL